MSGSGLPLRGRSILVCRPAGRADSLISALVDLGALVVHLPLIEVVPPVDGDALSAAIGRLARYDWVAFTSAHSVETIGRALIDHDPAFAWPAGTSIAVVGAATGQAVGAEGWQVDFMAAEFTGRELGRSLPFVESGPERPRILLPLAELAGPDLRDELVGRGANVDVVTAYRTITPDVGPTEIEDAVAAEAVLFTSGSTVDRLVGLLGRERVPPVIIAIGPSTAAAAERLGLAVADIADPHDLDGLISATLRTLGP